MSFYFFYLGNDWQTQSDSDMTFDNNCHRYLPIDLSGLISSNSDNDMIAPSLELGFALDSVRPSPWFGLGDTANPNSFEEFEVCIFFIANF
jgi:hypothetical protein